MKPWTIDAWWFSEINTMWPWICLSLEVKEVLCDFHSDFQHIVVFDSETFWKVLVLDWVIQLTERDESSYQEMMTHIPLHVHPDPKNVLIIGGWDGGMIRECVRHTSLESITYTWWSDYASVRVTVFTPGFSQRALYSDERAVCICEICTDLYSNLSRR